MFPEKSKVYLLNIPMVLFVVAAIVFSAIGVDVKYIMLAVGIAVWFLLLEFTIFFIKYVRRP